YLPLSPELRLSREVPIPPAVQEASLFAFPAQSNFSGVKHPLELVVEAQNLGYEVFLDAAAFVPTNPLDLSEVSPDYVAVSFYKMFGFPTGVGALLARKEAIRRLRRPWFAGGTVEYVSVQNRIHQFRVDAEAFEDGTLNFLSIAAVTPGLEFLAEVGMDRVRERVRQLTEVLLDSLRGLCHSDGSPLVEIYGPGDTTDRGGTVAFNLRGADGKIFPYANVEGAASVEGLSLRGGCFCNPGAGETAFDLPATEALRCFKAMPQGSFSLDELAQCIPEEVPVGALRASLGIVSTEEDLRRMTDFLGRYRDQSVPG
ncbi:MAG: aminotransferase class V-fold PLP-dependent enzyme, partial [Gemmatimonadota bacterium]|nr:aminotransferase class V-fold PLP-dependent enzyme [Gemmatimonadota bacterium]